MKRFEKIVRNRVKIRRVEEKRERLGVVRKRENKRKGVRKLGRLP